ncbi:ABC-type Fe3+/spermidine/putrescine transport system ATPase subunit [Skermanella aerolata]|uniref:ABC transporter ATP-binding protein n=1 Tax=Skermanella aerolata TaxID=393310 RepID=UPI003D1CC555
MLTDPITRPSSAPARDAGTKPAQPILEVIDATHAYDGVVALDNVTVRAAPGEFLTILGESGSGKTTLLRLISGLEKPYRIGALRLGGVDVSEVPAFQRDCTTVFQNYALFPHLTVGENVEYGLKMRGVPVAERRTRARNALELVQLADKYDRRIHQLSGGQRQRVALARALVPQPAILLLDEPLGALDEKLRVDMQVELLEIQKRLGMTFIYITHSQEEALTMSDRIILMRKGKIEQEGPPTAIFDRPVSAFAARFMGVENCFEGELIELSGGQAQVQVGERRLRGRWSGRSIPKVGAKVAVGVRAERLHLGPVAPTAPDHNVLPCGAGGAIYKGKYLDRTVTTDIAPIKVRIWNASAVTDQPSRVWWHKDDCIVMDL